MRLDINVFRKINPPKDVQAKREKSTKAAGANIRDRVLKALAGGGFMSASEIAAATGHSETGVRGSVTKLVEAGVVEKKRLRKQHPNDNYFKYRLIDGV